MYNLSSFVQIRSCLSCVGGVVGGVGFDVWGLGVWWWWGGLLCWVCLVFGLCCGCGWGLWWCWCVGCGVVGWWVWFGGFVLWLWCVVWGVWWVVCVLVCGVVCVGLGGVVGLVWLVGVGVFGGFGLCVGVVGCCGFGWCWGVVVCGGWWVGGCVVWVWGGLLLCGCLVCWCFVGWVVWWGGGGVVVGGVGGFVFVVWGVVGGVCFVVVWWVVLVFVVGWWVVGCVDWVGVLLGWMVCFCVGVLGWVWCMRGVVDGDGADFGGWVWLMCGCRYWCWCLGCGGVGFCRTVVAAHKAPLFKISIKWQMAIAGALLRMCESCRIPRASGTRDVPASRRPCDAMPLWTLPPGGASFGHICAPAHPGVVALSHRDRRERPGD
jgi:hypothetical protein